MSNINEYRMLTDFESWMAKQQMSKNTIAVYRHAAVCLLKYLNGKEPSKDIMSEYQKYLLLNYKPNSANLYLLGCRRYLIYCGYMPENMPKVVKIQNVQSIENILTLKEYNIMINYAKKNHRWKDYLIMHTLACTGIRIGELSYITTDALSVGKVRVYNKKKYREIYLPDKLVSELQDYCMEVGLVKGPVFLGSKGTSIDRRSVWEMLQKLAICCGIDKNKAHPHSFRHLFAKVYMEQYGNITELADILGHSSIETTRRYTMSTAQEKRDKLDRLCL